MNPAASYRLPPALENAVQRVRMAARSAAERTVDSLGLAALSSTNIVHRDSMLGAQFELNRKLAIFALTFNETLDERVQREFLRDPSGNTTTRPTGWEDLTLVEDREVELQVSADRFALEIQHQCEWEIRELDAYMGSLLRLGRPDHDRNPLRPEMVGLALMRAVEAVADRPEVRKVLATEIGRSLANVMRGTYAEIVADLRGAGVKPVGMTVRQVDGPGFQAGSRYNSGYDTLSGDLTSNAGMSSHGGADLGSSGMAAPSGLRSSSGALSTGGAPLSGRGQPGASGLAPTGGGAGAGTATRGGAMPRGATFGQVDASMMALMRRLSFAGGATVETGSAELGGDFGFGHAAGASTGSPAPLMAPNLIVTHRDELRQAATGALDHMVIDVVGSLFDQILSDPKVAPQMARQIARLQLPVLRAALGDPSFFSSRRHPVRRFVNRIASLGAAFDDFDADEGRAFLKLVKDLVQEIVEGDFDQIQLYEQKLSRLEAFIAEQARREAQEQGGADEVLEKKELELRLHQRYAQQLRGALAPLPLDEFMREFLASVWSQAVLRAERVHGADGELTQRLRKAGRELVMSVQPKGSPAMRKAFLMSLPQLMKDLNTGMDLVRWPEPARKDFFAKLLPAHAESLKGQAMTTLDWNLLAKQVDQALGVATPKANDLPPVPVGAALEQLHEAATPAAFTEEEAKAIGLVDEQKFDWNGQVDIDLGAEPEVSAVDINIDGLPPPEPVEPTRGKSLADHVQIGFAYQMHLDDGWHKVRLTHVSPGRTFFVFTRGHKHKRTISMTYRMLAKLCETGRLRAFESGYLLERATARARRQLAQLRPGGVSSTASMPITRH